MRKVALLWLLLLPACTPPNCNAPEGTASFTERVFQKRDSSGTKTFTVHARATGRVAPELLDLLEQELRVLPVQTTSAAQLAFWRDRPMPLIASRAEVQIELVPADAGVDLRSFTYTWPDPFRISRPGVLEVRPEYTGVRPRKTDVAVSRQALGSAQSLKGRVLCQGNPVRQVAVVAGGRKGQTRNDGTFEIGGPFDNAPSRVYVAFEANIAPAPSLPAVTPRFQIMDDFHGSRNESVDQAPNVAAGVADFGDVTLGGTDCILWDLGVRALEHYVGLMQRTPPTGQLRIKRWQAIYTSGGAGPHTFYDYIVVPTDEATAADREHAIFHEFGHVIRHVADGDETHWHWDDFRFNYGHAHNSTELFNKGFAFNEGWANYWAFLNGTYLVPAGPAGTLDWNEGLIAQRLVSLSRATSHPFMVGVLDANRGNIHTIYDFEQRYCAALFPASNPFCRDGAPVRAAPASCPPDYTDDGATCRLNNIQSKPSTTRGAGLVPTSCGPGMEYDWGLCYPTCPAGFHGVGPVCWQECPPGYTDDGATCRRDAQIIGADNSACPWYDLCGLTFAGGCSVCPGGYHNDGCTCRIDVDIFGKGTQTRGVGSVPQGCAAPMEYDTGLCYQPCPPGYHGVGPVCWGTCPAGFDDHGATCYRAPKVFSDD